MHRSTEVVNSRRGCVRMGSRGQVLKKKKGSSDMGKPAGENEKTRGANFSRRAAKKRRPRAQKNTTTTRSIRGAATSRRSARNPQGGGGWEKACGENQQCPVNWGGRRDEAGKSLWRRGLPREGTAEEDNNEHETAKKVRTLELNKH